jgi:hypothetical protein
VVVPVSNVLNSWKEIAAYLNRGVRTVQRWERDLGLPVRRPRGHDRSAVIAIPEELDQWLRQAPEREHVHANNSQNRERLHKNRERLAASMSLLLLTLDRTRTICTNLQEKHANRPQVKNGAAR